MSISSKLINNMKYNIILKMVNITFPLITFAYIARVISVEGVGKIDFSLSIVNWFIILSSLGIPIYGVRECSKVRDDKDKLSKVFQEIFFINLVSSIIVFIIFYLIVNSSQTLRENYNLMLILGLQIVFNIFSIEWLFQAVEDYKFLTIRNIVIRIISIIFIFIFVKEDSDYISYAWIMSFAIITPSLFNFYYSRKIIKYKMFNNYNFKNHMKPIFALLFMNLAASIYVNLDKVMLGYIKGDEAVGIYSAANKIIRMITAFLSAATTVLLPRMSYYIENEYIEKFNKVFKLTLKYLLFITIPAIVGVVILSDNIILLLGGDAFVASSEVLIVIAPVILFLSLSNLIGIQVLIPLGKESTTLVSVIIAAFTNFTLNLILINKMSYVGAAIATVISEGIVVAIQLYTVRNYMNSFNIMPSIIKFFVGTFVFFPIIYFVRLTVNSNIAIIVITIFLCAIAYLSFLYLIKEETIVEIKMLVTNHQK